MQGGDGDAGVPAQQPGEVDREENLRELALAVGADAGVRIGALEHQIVEVERHLPRRGDVDDAGGHARLQQGQQLVRQ